MKGGGGEEEESIAPLCTCGQFYSHEFSGSHKPSVAGSNKPRKAVATWLESSFVHLMAPRRPSHITSSSSPLSSGGKSPGFYHQHPFPHYHHHTYTHSSPHGFWEEHQHVEQLLQVATSSSVIPTDTSLCSDCIDRVANALDADTQRLYGEVQAYQDAVTEAQQRAKTLEHISKVNLQEAEQAYLEEVSLLQQEIDAREAEMAHLTLLLKEQHAISQELGIMAEHVQHDQNALELRSKSFDDSTNLLYKTLITVQTEVDELSIVRLPLSLFDLQVDERGLRYPLINQLRLAFRPKGDASESEIRAAWSQATQLLLILGTLLQYPSSEWKLVPLADCAKLIYRKEIFNLKPGDCRSLMAWNALLDQIIRHAKTVFAAAAASANNNTTTTLESRPPLDPTTLAPPFSSSPSSIGNTELARLDRSDHVGWSQVIHRMASNLLWLSERVSELVAFQVSTLAHSVT